MPKGLWMWMLRRFLLGSQPARGNSQVTAMTSALRLLSLARNRTFVTTQLRRAAPAPTPPATPAILRRSPTAEDIQTAELDVEPLAQGDAQLTLTERAAQVCRDFDFSGSTVLTHYAACVATLSNIFPTRAFRFSPANIRRIGRLPWISI